MRIGHGAKGMLYGLLGLFAVNDIIYDHEIVSGSEDVLVSLARRPLGSIVLGLLAFGLFGYVLWRLTQAILAPGHSGELGVRHVLQRCGYAISGFTYLGIAHTAGKLALGFAVDFDDTVEDLASVLFEWTVGPWMLLAVGLGVVVVGLTYLYGAASGSYINEFRRDLYSAPKKWAIFIGKVGITARGIGFMLIGTYLMKAAFLINGDLAGDLGNVFDQLDDQPFGNVWLGAISFGFIAYAIYMIVAAYYRNFPCSHLQKP